MDDIQIRILILFSVVICTLWYIDLPHKLSELHQLKIKLATLQNKRNKSRPKTPKKFFVRDERHPEEVLNAFVNVSNQQGFFIKKISDVTWNTKNGFVETNFSLQIIGDFIPLLSSLRNFDLPVLMHHFTIEIVNGAAILKTNMTILHVKNNHKPQDFSVAIIRSHSENYSIHFFPDGRMQWRKI